MLQSGHGGPVGPQPRSGRGGRRKGLVIGGALVGFGALATGGVFAYSAYFASGPQPAEALPADTVGYLSVDLDPSGQQKLEALKTLRKFPAFKENAGLGTDDDLREKLFDSIQGDGVCPEVDYADDIEPWLGDRMAVAAVDLGRLRRRVPGHARGRAPGHRRRGCRRRASSC